MLIQTKTPDGKQSGLFFDSVVNCVNVVTLDKNRVLRKLGHLPDGLMQRVNAAVKVALELS